MASCESIAARPEPPSPDASRRISAAWCTTVRPGGAGLARTVAVSVLVAGLIGFNAWWYWRDTRPLADPRAIDVWIGRQDYARAESALRERLRRAPHDGAARMTLARVLAARGDLPGCARELERVPFWWPRKAEAQFRAGQAFLMADRARDAESALLAILDTDPLHPPDPGLYHDASQELLKIYATEDRWDDAFDVIWKAHDHAAPADRPLMLSMRIRCELERVAPSQTVKVLLRYVAADPQDFEALRALAKAELALGQRAEALRNIEACLRGRPEDARIWRDNLTMLQSLGERDALDAAMARLPRSADAEPEIWMFRGQVKEERGDTPGAAEAYRRALELNPNLQNAHYRLAMIEGRLGHREQALAHRKRWEELRDARALLPEAGREYQAALVAISAPGPPQKAEADLKSSTRRLASLCATLGWARAAQAFNQVAARL